MRLQFWGPVAQGLLRFFAQFPWKADLLRLVIFTADKWGIKRQPGGGIAFPFVKKRRDLAFQVLVYHRVNDDGNPFCGAVPASVFKDQMRALYEYFNVLPLEELVRRATSQDIPPRAVAITFDDGYRDNYENAFPVLKEFNLPATVFLTTSVVNTRSSLWHDSLFEAFRRTNVKTISIEGKDYPLTTSAEKHAGVNAFRRYLRNYNHNRTCGLLAELRSKLHVQSRCTKRSYLSWHEVEEMSKFQITFGAHTVNHPILTRMSLRDAANEIITSRDTIEKKLGSSVRLFAYPNGHRDDFSEPIKRVLKEAGFLCAATILFGNNDARTDPFELRRIGMWDSDPILFTLRLAGYKFLAY